MRKQIRGLDQASTNAEDGVSAVQTAEGALTEVHSMLQRMNELAVQASNGTNSQSDRQAIQDEISQLTTEIDRVAETTKFNETYLLKGDDGTKKLNLKAHDAGLAGTLTDNGDGTATFKMKDLNAGDKVTIGGKEYTIAATKTEAEDFTALEIQEESADMARRSVLYNHLEEKIQVVTGDIKDASGIFGASSFDIITTNPPYMIGQHGLTNPEEAKAIARHEILCNLTDIMRESARILKPGGHFFMVHRPFRLTEIICCMHEHRIEPKRMRLVYPYADREPNMVLIEGCRGGRSRMTVEKPLIVYKEPNVYTDEIYEIYDL